MTGHGAQHLYFAVGSDTFERLVAERYYPAPMSSAGAGSQHELSVHAPPSETKYERMLRSLRGLAVGYRPVEAGVTVKFVVGGRASGGGSAFDDGKARLRGLPEDVRNMFILMEEEEFRADISSTDIRAGNARAGL